MKKQRTSILLIFFAVLLGVGVWYFIQKDYHPVLKEDVLQQKSSSSSELSEDNLIEEKTIADNDWGVILTAKDITPDGMTLVCTQTGGNPTGELSTGAWYEIETLVSGKWQQASIYAEVCWEDIAWIIPKEDSAKWQVNWTWIYGSLEPGEYRIAKEITDFRQSGDFDTCRSYAYFTIE